MTAALLTIRALCILIIGGVLFAILRQIRHDTANLRLFEIGEDSERHIAHDECFPHTIFNQGE